MGRVIRTASAMADILAIAEHIAEDKPVAAERWVMELDKTLALIAEQPLMGESVDHLARNMRRHCLRNYLLFYVPVEGGIEFAACSMAPAGLKICSDRRHALRQIAVHIATAADANHQHQQHVVLNLIDDAIIADADAVKRLYTCELLDAPWPRILGQPIDPPGNAPPVRLQYLGEHVLGGPLQFDTVNHAAISAPGSS